jgi:predicted small lipoprotein YifL
MFTFEAILKNYHYLSSYFKTVKQLRKMDKLLRGSLFIALLFTLASCGILGPATESRTPTKPNKNQGNKPNTGQGAKDNVLVDTIRWRVDPKSKPPIVTGGKPSGNTSGNPSGGVITYPTDNTSGGVITYPTDNTSGGVIVSPTGGTKSSYEMALLMPFFTAQFSESAGNPPKSQFALDFYAGVRIALDSLSTQLLNLKVSVLDSRGDFNALLGRYELTKADVILGPVEKENVPTAMDFANRQGKIFVSPYFPTGDVEGANPRFIQVKPSLKTHCDNITSHIRARYQTNQVVLVGRQRDNETARFKFFQDANSAFNQSTYGGRFDEWAIEDELNFNVEPYIHAEGQTVFVLPSWNEVFVASFLRKLAASPRKASVMIYGMPQWMDFDKSLTSIYESLKVRVSSSTFIEAGNPDVKHFRSKFMAKFGKLPNSDSFLGYDCALYVGKMLNQYGTAFPQYIQNERQQTLHTRFNFEPVYRPVVNDSDPNGNVAKYENRYVNMLKYQNGAFRIDQ